MRVKARGKITHHTQPLRSFCQSRFRQSVKQLLPPWQRLWRTVTRAAGPSIQFVPAPQSTIGLSTSSNPMDTTGNSDGLVQASASEVLENITGGVVKPQENATSSKNPFISASVPLAQRVPGKVRNKIWADEYVDFSTLFHTQDSEGGYILKFQNSEGNTAVSMVPNIKKQAVCTIEQWTTAFVAVYTEKYRDEAPSIMKYCSIIRELAFQSANWKFYDENVRLLRQKEPWPWHQIHRERYLRALSDLNKNNSNPSNQGTRPQHKANGAPFPKGFCWKFHNRRRCSGCSFKHQCFKCGNAHPISPCQQNPKPAGGRVARLEREVRKCNFLC